MMFVPPPPRPPADYAPRPDDVRRSLTWLGLTVLVIGLVLLLTGCRQADPAGRVTKVGTTPNGHSVLYVNYGGGGFVVDHPHVVNK